MLETISKILTGDMLKAMSDMCHGDVLVIGDANFPGERLSETTHVKKVFRCPGIDATTLYEAIIKLFPLDVDYVDYPAQIMDLTNSDKEKGMPEPIIWSEIQRITQNKYPGLELGKVERFEFYNQAAKSYVIIMTGEERQYGNIMITKGVIL